MAVLTTCTCDVTLLMKSELFRYLLRHGNLVFCLQMSCFTFCVASVITSCHSSTRRDERDVQNQSPLRIVCTWPSSSGVKLVLSFQCATCIEPSYVFVVRLPLLKAAFGHKTIFLIQWHWLNDAWRKKIVLKSFLFFGGGGVEAAFHRLLYLIDGPVILICTRSQMIVMLSPRLVCLESMCVRRKVQPRSGHEGPAWE